MADAGWYREMENALPYICTGLAALITTLVCTPLAKKLAIRLDAVDYPSKRRINTVPIPRMGGLAVFAGIVVGMLVRILGAWYLGWPAVLIPHPRNESLDYRVLAVSFLIIVATGVLDDVKQIKPLAKFAGQVLAASVAAAGGLVINSFLDPFDSGAVFELGWIGYPVTVLYLVAFANIINLIDGLDGLATGISGIASLSMFSFAVLAGNVDAAALSIAVAGACLGFLKYNFHPASIFLGDTGSLLLGYSLGVISLLNVSRTAALTTLLIPLIVAGVPILDTFSAIVRRLRAHVSIGQADKGHIHHRLIQEGYDQRQAVLLIYAWTALLSVGAMVINQVGVRWRVVIFLVLLVASVAFANHLHLFEPVLRHHYNEETHEDELVTPDDPAFEEEERAEQVGREERKAHLKSLGPQGSEADQRVSADERDDDADRPADGGGSGPETRD